MFRSTGGFLYNTPGFSERAGLYDKSKMVLFNVKGDIEHCIGNSQELCVSAILLFRLDLPKASDHW